MFCTRIEWALKLKGLEDEMIVEDWSKGEERIALEVEPSAQEGPGDFGRWRRVAGSKVILEYIDEKWKGACLRRLGSPLCRMWAGKGESREAALECSKYPEKQIEGKKFFAGREDRLFGSRIGSVSWKKLEA
ncbi:hypothetical protein NL676_022223 [Syzygium grande]|nr:hypothetical protein NL676_022223 [Syzygium grande]